MSISIIGKENRQLFYKRDDNKVQSRTFYSHTWPYNEEDAKYAVHRYWPQLPFITLLDMQPATYSQPFFPGSTFCYVDNGTTNYGGGVSPQLAGRLWTADDKGSINERPPQLPGWSPAVGECLKK